MFRQFLHQQLSLHFHLKDFLHSNIWHLHQIADGHIFLQSITFYFLGFLIRYFFFNMTISQIFSENQIIWELPAMTMFPVVFKHSSTTSQVPPMVSHSGSWKIETIHYLSCKSIFIEGILLTFSTLYTLTKSRHFWTTYLPPSSCKRSL